MGILANILQLRHKAEESITSLPALTMKAEKISANIMHGMHAQKKAGSGEKFWQFREYNQTDRPQDIDWRQSAKTDNIYIKQKEWQTTQKTFLWCASGSSMHFTSTPDSYTKQDCAHVIALALALILKQSEEQIGLFGDIKTGRSEEKIQKIGEALFARSTINEELPLTQNFALPNHASFIGIGDFLSGVDDIERALTPIAEHAENALIIQVLDPAEINLNYQGRVRFRGLLFETNIKNALINISNTYNPFAMSKDGYMPFTKQILT